MFTSESCFSIKVKPTIILKKWNIHNIVKLYYIQGLSGCLPTTKLYYSSLSKIKFRWLYTYMRVIDSGLQYQLVGMDALMWYNLVYLLLLYDK